MLRSRAHPLGRAFVRTVRTLARIELVDRATTLAAQMFTSVLPVLMVARTMLDSTLLESTALGASLRHRFGIDTTVLPLPDLQDGTQAAAFGIVGVLMVLIGGTSFARALGRMYGRVWRTTSPGLAHAWRWFAVLFVVAASTVLIGAAQLIAVPALLVACQWCVWASAWTLCPYLLVSDRVPTRVVLGTGALTATLLSALDGVSRVVMPSVIAESSAHFGTLGLVFTAIGWLFAVALVLVVAPVLVEATLRA
ncbi:hypothetical protein [Rhodococcus sp. HNM0569]|uniref:hypothetical protein n=1 Tax=Rhodococcus sp. HNM0569 TaxID=2716340 RepID=UPI00146F3FAC|nr:hypothetical protein [Rhodococcus sp. HNM0569]NLU84684.1 hypothetical protein [Rhodococcus sp. HNM0569]